MGKSSISALQERLANLMHFPGPADGVIGPRTVSAMQDFLDTHINSDLIHFEVSAKDGEITIVGPTRKDQRKPSDGAEKFPWMVIARKQYGLNETRDNAALIRFLQSDRATVGDPKKLPWCGDFVETCMKLAIPNLVWSGDLGENPYFARNWMQFGKPCPATYGAVVIFERGQRHGHVGFLVGQDETAFYVLGGNQSDSVTIARIAKGRALGFRWPETLPTPRIAKLPAMNPGQTAISTNEA